MPQYFFHIRDEDEFARDEEGIELPDLEAACREADAGARDLLADAIRSHRRVGNKRLEITDEHGLLMATVILRDLMR